MDNPVYRKAYDPVHRYTWLPSGVGLCFSDRFILLYDRKYELSVSFFKKKFIFSVIREGARAKDFEIAIQWLVDCGLVIKIHRVSKPGMPLIAYQDLSVFKLFLHDVGLLGAMAGIQLHALINGDAVFKEFEGALTEQYVMQQLRIDSNRYIGYWTNERSTSEVDFIVQDKGNIIPVEVKSGENFRAKSFRLFCEKYNPERAVRTSLTPCKEEGWMTNIPLYGI